MKEKRADSLPADADELANIVETNSETTVSDLGEGIEEPIITPSENETSN